MSAANAGPSGSGSSSSSSSSELGPLVPHGMDEPNPTLPPPRAPLTLGNIWQALKMTRLEDFSPAKLGEIPCMRQSLLQGLAGGTGFAVLRLLSGKPGFKTAVSAYGWFVGGFLIVGGAANTYCQQKRQEEIEMMRLVQQRYPERNIVTAGRRAKALYEEEEARLARGEPPRTEPIVDPALGQKVNFKKAPRVEVSQPGFVEVRDSDGEFVGRMSPAMAELAKSRGATETFKSVAKPAPAPASQDRRGIFEAISEER